ncbi:MAG: hypothetical protein ABI222_16955 [Opitutaceae bacterium]
MNHSFAMLSDRIRILDFDGSVARQVGLLNAPDLITIDLRTLGPEARLWADSGQADMIRRCLTPELRDAVTLLGSGDYHYVSAILLEQFEDPISVIAFDHHPDWETLPPRRGCGAWVSRAIEQENVARVLLVGNGSDDLRFPSILTGNLRGLREGRICMLPWEFPASGFFPRPRLSGLELKPAPLKNLAAALDQLPTRRVYLSIDKDCLRSPFALTNWEEGSLDLDFLVAALRLIRERCEIIGADIVGEFSVPRHTSNWKALCSRIDHPTHYTARGRMPEEIDRVNAATNRAILAALKS